MLAGNIVYTKRLSAAMELIYRLQDETFGKSGIDVSSPCTGTPQAGDKQEFATIDGGVIDYQACEQAVSNGAGIFIGGYFVGVMEYTQCYSQQTFMRN